MSQLTMTPSRRRTSKSDRYDIDDGDVAVANYVAEQYARRIVTAVNCHDELLAACKESLAYLKRRMPRNWQETNAGKMLVAAVAKAEGVAEERERAEWDAANVGERWDGQS